MSDRADDPTLTRYAWLSIGAALVTMVLKAGAYLITDSVGLLSDAAESLVNLAGAIMALSMLTVAARPADEDHMYGHGKAEYFSSGVEGTLILVAAAGIAWAAIGRLIAPQPLEQVGLGLAVSVLASGVNLAAAIVIRRAGRRHHSITLEANSQHLFTDVWTSVGVLAGVALVALTGWLRLDPLVALIVAANITLAGLGILRQTVQGLMDSALPAAEQAALRAVLARHVGADLHYHALRTRQAGARRFASVHVLVPGDWTVQRGHGLLDELEADMRAAVPNLTVFTHLEPLEDPRSWDDTELDRHQGERYVNP